MNRYAGIGDEAVLAAFTEDRDGQGAFSELVDRYERRVYGICYRYFGNHSDAQDATQDTFLTLVRRAETFRGEAKLSTWIYRVAVNACNDLARKRARRPQTPVEDLTDLAGEDPHAQEVLEGHETAMAIQTALGELDELSRTLLILIAIEGQGYKEVAEALDLPIGTVKSRVHRARAQMADLLADLRDGGDHSPEHPRAPNGDTPTPAPTSSPTSRGPPD
ncbi:MAG TPA: sigma-70 family RNA polymerase sigma factor [Nitriliruptorales bacterium]